jgi:fibrillarin-like pre-rRNA processing protein
MQWIDGMLVSPGNQSLYGERIVQGYRVWDPWRSKCAALATKVPEFDLKADWKVLYLGAAHGATVSHVAAYVEVVYAVEIAPRPMQDLLHLCQTQGNIIPLMADATDPGSYAHFVEAVDLLYMDVAHPDQAAIALAHRPFLQEDGRLVMMLKASCVDSLRPREEVHQEVKEILSEKYTILRSLWLDPYHPDHAAILAEVLI